MKDSPSPLMNCERQRRWRRIPSEYGFTLIQVCVLLTVAALTMVVVLPSSQTNLTAANVTTAKMNAILTALRGYEAANASLPCPADASQPIGSNTYGVAAGNPGTGTTGNCTGGTPAANFVDSTNNVAIGMVPVRTLGLSNRLRAGFLWPRHHLRGGHQHDDGCWGASAPGKIAVTDNGTVTTASRRW